MQIVVVEILLQELRFISNKPMLLHCDNNAAYHIATNPVIMTAEAY